MTDNNKTLVSAGHELASELKADCGAVDMRSVANLLTELASALDVQSARSDALAAENMVLIGFDADEFSYNGPYQPDDAVLEKLKTPATDAWVKEQRAAGADLTKQQIEAAMKSCYQDEQIGLIEAAEIAGSFAAQLRGSQV